MLCSNDVLTVVGYVTVLYFTIKTVKFFRRICNEALWSTTTDFKKYGEWAIVTGASDGIGKGITVELAKCGMNIVLIARTKSKLEQLAKELSNKYKIEIKTIAIDFTDADQIYDNIEEVIKNLDVAILVNNVGIAITEPYWYLDVPQFAEYSKNIVRVNVLAMLKMTNIILPNMVNKGKGIIANVSSVVGSRGSPFMTIYGASKKLVINLTESMSREYKEKGVIFQCIVPAITRTPMTASNSFGLGSRFIPTAESYGRYVIKSLGKSEFTNTALFLHNFVQICLWLIPDFLYTMLMRAGAKNTSAMLKRK